MANILHNTNDMLDMILPVWGQPRIDLPIWDKMIISPLGYRSYHYFGTDI